MPKWCFAGWRPLAALLLAVSLSGCASQSRDDVQVRIGIGETKTEPATNYASLYAPYAMMATAAYADPPVLNRHLCPDVGLLGLRSNATTDDEFAFHGTVRGWIKTLNQRRWECHFGHVGKLECPKRNPNCKATDGLEFHVWRRMDGGCREVAIAFRGTDRRDSGDWQSNFRWFKRLEPRFDQYDQVREHMERIVQRVEDGGCRGAATRFVSVGHSLGGGLAQQAAYASPKIRYVYAFDPSPVTGFFDISELLREKHMHQLGVDRTYESGEILTLPRHILENIFPPEACNPSVRTVRFNLLSGLPASQHNMQQLANQMHEMARKQRVVARLPAEHPASGYPHAVQCGVVAVVPKV
jgi:pimeloyl-ACP methyl ester carboxylesterase